MAASVRIEQKVFTDPRFAILGKLMGVSRFDAIGRMASVYSHCTEIGAHSLSGSVIDVVADFDGFADLISRPDVNLAEIAGNSLRIKGTEGRVEWLEACRENGKKGGRPKLKPNPNLGVNQTLTGIEPESNLPTPTPTPTPRTKKKEESLASLGVVDKPPSPEILNPKKAKDPGLGERVNQFFKVYHAAFKQRWGTTPDDSARTFGQIRALVASQRDFQKLLDLVQVYVQMEDPWFVKRGHDIATFSSSLNQIRISMTHGKNFSEVESSMALSQWAKKMDEQERQSLTHEPA